MTRIAFVLLAAVIPHAASAQEDLRDVIVNALRAEGCTMDNAGAERVFGGMGLDRAAFGEALAAMEEAGEVMSWPSGDRIDLAPELCGDGRASAEPPAVVVPGAAPSPRDAILAYARAWDCELSEPILLDLVVYALERPRAEGEAALASLIEAGEARIDPASGWVEVAPAFCTPAEMGYVSDSSAWIEQWLSEAEGCRLPLAEVVARGEAEGLDPATFDYAAAALIGSGMVRQEGPDLVHALACDAPALEADPLKRIAAADDAGFRGLLALHLMANGCRVTAANRALVIAAVAEAALPQVGLGPDAPPEAMGALRSRVEEVLDNPGPAYEIDRASGDLVMVHCTP